eukprot:jgi/Tetstr1/424013/TSEL_014624.t1
MATTPPAVADTVSDPRSDVLYNVRKQLLQHFRGDNLDSSRLTFVKHLGAGEFGRVDQYDYLDKNNVKVKLALKLLNRDLLCNENDVRNFINEMRTLRRLNHPAIAAYAGTGIITAESHDPGKGPTGKMEEHVYLAQECCEGETMQDLILRQMKCRPGTQLYKWSEVVEWMIAVSSALNYMHTNKPMVIHRDLKPANLIIIDKGEGLREIKLVDFGLHKIIHLHSEESIRGAGRSGRGPGGSVRGPGGSVRGPGGSVRGGSQNNSGHSSGKSGLNPSMEAMLHLSTASRKNKSAHDAVWQEMLKAGADMHTGTNGSVHARNTFSGLQDIGYEMTGGCGSLIYMAPEVHRGEQYNHAVDMFAIALIFWEFFAFRMQLTMVGFGTEEGTSFEAVAAVHAGCLLREQASFAKDILPRLKDIRGLVLDLEAKGTCPSFRGVLPGMTLAPPKPEKQPSFMKKLKSMLKK